MLVALAVVMYGLDLGIDLLPVGAVVGVASGLATGAAWGFARRRGLRPNVVGVIATWGVLLPGAWFVGRRLGFHVEDTGAFALFLYLTMILPLQVVAPVSAALRRGRGRTVMA